MLAHKHITKIVALLTAFAVCLCLVATQFAETWAAALNGTGVHMEYESKLFDTSQPIEINLVMDEDDWKDMLTNAIDEEYYSCDVEINGETFYRVGVRPKGNTSLSSIVSDPDTDRYSFKLEFDRYVDGQTCFGLDKLILNNNYADATNMKEALVYDMYQYLDTDASLYNYAKISVNGTYWGVYLALEAVEDSFLLRNYGTENGALYKPESMDGGGPGGQKPQGNQNFPERTQPDIQNPENTVSPDASAAEESSRPAFHFGGENGFPPMPDGEDFHGQQGPGGFSMGGQGADLNYSDGDLDSYSTIWEGEVTDTSKSDHKRVVTALKNIAEGTDLETYMDLDNLLRYMAVHTFSVNNDSLSGNMAHNYYLYETGGRLNLIPWDYNLAWGGMGGGGSASSVINDAIDTPFAATKFFDKVLENETYLAQYHAYLQQLVDEYVNGGGFAEFYQRTRSQLDGLVETDPTAFYSYEEYTAAVEMLKQVIQLRGQSVAGQLDGSIPSTDTAQREDSSALVDGSSLDLSVMGTMGGHGGSNFGGHRMNRENRNNQTPNANPDTNLENPEDSENGGVTIQAVAHQTIPTAADGSTDTNPENPAPPEGSVSGENPSSDTPPAGMENIDDVQNREAIEAMGNLPNQNRAFPGQNPTGNNGQETASVTQNLILYSVCFGILLAALLFTALYRRKSYRR